MDFIYALVDPRDNQIRYIGKTDNPERRLAMHMRDKDICHRTNWLKGLIAVGSKPAMTIIEEVAEGQSWEDRERHWIAHYRSLGCKLTNMTDGGEQGPDCTGKKLPKSEQWRKNITAMLTERNKSPKMREISRQSGLKNKGRKKSQETIEKHRQWMTGRKIHTDETKKALAERNKTRDYNPDIMKNNSRELWDDPVKGSEMRAKLIERNKSKEFREIVSKKAKERNTSEVMRERSKSAWDDPIKGAELRKQIKERNKARQYNPETMKANSRKGWGDPIKGPELRRRQSERMKDRHRKNRDKDHNV